MFKKSHIEHRTIKSRIKKIASLCAVLALAGCASLTGGKNVSNTGAGNSLVSDTKTGEWYSLFDGKTLRGWVGINGAPIGDQWQIIDGELVLTGAGGGDILTEAQYRNFELSLEWKISREGNSGIFYRVAPGPGIPWMSGLEYQLLDDENSPDFDKDSHAAGSVFDLYAPREKVVNPALEYNKTRIVVDDNHVEHWLNGKKVLEFELWSRDWMQRLNASKFANAEKFARSSQGRIGLQDHGHKIWFKNIKIRSL